MSEWTPSPQFEDEIRAALSIPMARDEFITNLHRQIVKQAAQNKFESKRPCRVWPAWSVSLVLLLILLSFLLAGPQRVVLALRTLFGYLPGVGIVDPSAPLRVLAAPVSVTRDGISITVTSALLTGEKTHLEYRIFGVPGSAYTTHEEETGCVTPEFLLLPNGEQLRRINNDFEAVPASFDSATFVLPCIFNTRPGKAPENWELPIQFVPAPPTLTVMPVIDVSPSPQPTLQPAEATALPSTAGTPPATGAEKPITIIKEIETSDGYILVAQFPFDGLPRERVTNSVAEIRDANGKKVAFTQPQDMSPQSLGLKPEGPYWLIQFNESGLAYPLTLQYSGASIQSADPTASAHFSFDVGAAPHSGQKWFPDQSISLAGHSLKLVEVMADSRHGYNFHFSGEPDVIQADLQIDGYTPTGHGFGRGVTPGGFNVSLSFDQFPTGILNVTLSRLIITGAPLSWQGQWSPSAPRSTPLLHSTPPGPCQPINETTQRGALPAALSQGKALIYEKTDDRDSWGLVLYNLDGSRKQVVTPKGNWGAVSSDGSKAAYSALDRTIHWVDLHSMTDHAIQNAAGFNIQWSPDGTSIAYIGTGNGSINSVFIVQPGSSQVRQISKLSYATLIGWTSDGKQLYFAVPFTGGVAWKVYSYDLNSGTTLERFTIENGTPKNLNARISPDGKWIAYRGRDNSSVYLVRPDGSDLRLVIDRLGVTGLEWSQSGWLGAALRDANSNEALILFHPEECKVYQSPPSLRGSLNGLIIP